jgi:3-oxoacyl-[acyl-carrier-protein] synthase II
VKAIQTGQIHPTINLDDPEDVGFDLPKKAERHTISAAISNSFGFGGHNATIVLAPFKG